MRFERVLAADLAEVDRQASIIECRERDVPIGARLLALGRVQICGILREPLLRYCECGFQIHAGGNQVAITLSKEFVPLRTYENSESIGTSVRNSRNSDEAGLPSRRFPSPAFETTS